MGKIHKFHNLHARVGHLWDTDKADGSEVIVAEIDPHGFMGNMETRQEVAELLASAPRLAEQVHILQGALEANKLRMEIAAEYLHRFQGACAYHGDQLVRAIKAANIALETTKEQS